MSVSHRPVSARRGDAVSRGIALIVLLAAAVLVEPSHADPGDFQAMPGLWKIVTRVIDHGHEGAPQVAWHCVDESPDPWAEFANLPVPDADQCQRIDAHRSSTALSWSMQCPQRTTPARGRVKFDSAEHYTASLSVDGQNVVVVEGRRYAACTSPKD